MSQKKGRNRANGNGKPFANPRILLQELKNSKRVVDIFSADPSRIGRAWATTNMEGVDTRTCIDLIEQALVKLAPVVVQSLVDHLGETNYGGIWPNCFFEQAGLASMWAVARAADRCEGMTDKFLATCRRLFAENKRWPEILGLVAEPSNEDVVHDVVTCMTGICVTMGHIPLPKKNFRIIKEVTVGDQTFKIRGSEDDRVLSVLCWLGETDMKVVDWSIDDDEAFDLALSVLGGLLSSLCPDERYLEIIQTTVESEVLDRVESLWSDIRRVVNGDSSSGFRRWIMGGGLTHLQIQFSNKGLVYEVGPITLTPRSFPRVEVDIPWHPCSLFPMMVVEKVQINPGSGLFEDFSDLKQGSDERRLHLRINLAIVEALHELAFAPIYCDNQSRERSRNGGNGHSGKAVLPHFRRLATRRSGKMDEASPEALDRAVNMVGMEPPDGYTFAASPPIVCKTHNPTLKPVELWAKISV